MSMPIDQKRYEREVADRAGIVMKAIVEAGRMNAWNAHAFLALDAASPDEIIEAVAGLFGPSGAHAHGSVAGGPFHVMPASLLLARWRDRLPGEAIEMIREFFTSGIIDRGNTENHWLMHYTGCLIAAEAFADEKRMWNGLAPAAVRAEAMRWISGMIDRSAMNGHHEYDSTGYIAEHVTPLIGVAEYAGDGVLREKARKMLALHFADIALEYYHGAWAGGHSREGYRVNTWTQSGTVRGLNYVYFGNEEFDPEGHIQGFIVPDIVTSYYPPALIVSMAFERDKAFAVKKTKAPRTIYRHAEREAGPIRKYTWMSRSFALGSTRLNLPGPPAGPIDLTSWDLTWDGPKHQAKIVCNHPYRAPGRFSAFLSMLPQVAGRDVGTGKPYLQWPDRLFGASPYEQIMQHEGSAIILYRIDPADPDPYVNLYLPKGLAWTERNGWLFADVTNHEHAKTEGFHLAISPVGPYRWHEIREAVSSNIMVRDGDLIDGWMLRIEDPNAGLVLEAVEKDGRMSFDEFVDRRAATRPDTNLGLDGSTASFTTSTGDELSMTFDGPHLVNGTAIDYDSWPLYESPWGRAETGRGVVRFAKDGEELELDFAVTEPLIPMRVIG
jgi:hypothetical protein